MPKRCSVPSGESKRCSSNKKGFRDQESGRHFQDRQCAEGSCGAHCGQGDHDVRGEAREEMKLEDMKVLILRLHLHWTANLNFVLFFIGHRCEGHSSDRCAAPHLASLSCMCYGRLLALVSWQGQRFAFADKGFRDSRLRTKRSVL